VIRARDRERLQKHLTDVGVETLIHYPIPPHLQEAYADLGLTASSLAVCERLASEVLSLPIGPHLSDAQVQTVSDEVRSVLTGVTD